MTDPKCPHCKTPASEHEANQCLNAFIAKQKGWTAWRRTKYGLMGSAGGEAYAPQVPLNYLDWQHAGPLLEEMKAELTCRPSSDEWTVLLWENDRCRMAVANHRSPTLAICRAYLIWKANQK